MFSEAVSEVIRTYSGATKIPALYVNVTGDSPRYLPQQLNYDALMNYFDFAEIMDFIEYVFSQNSGSSSGIVTYHTIHTQNYFIYNVVFTAKCLNIKGAIISGPILIYPPDEKRIEEIMAFNKMPLHKKPELREILKNLPLASMEQIDYSGRLLLALCTSDIKSWASLQAEVHGRIKPGVEAVFNRLIGAGVYDSERNTVYRHLYKFVIDLKEKIIHGKTSELSELLDRSIDILWSAETSRDIFRTLKSNCIALCSLSCIYAIQGKAPIEIMMHLLYKFLERIEILKTSDEIVSCMMTIARTYAHAVSVLADNTYSMHVNRAMQYIKIHYMEDITLETLAKHTQINPVYLSGLIKKETKLSLSDNINKVRIAQSKNLLIYTNKSLNEIAHAVGYNYQNHFSLMFKKFSGITPFEFRKKYGQYAGK
jgi:AraC-like DNA-binding protein